MTPQELTDLLNVAIFRAPALRQSGVTAVEIGNIRIYLALADGDPGDGGKPDPQDQRRSGHSLDDPDTFGGDMPGLPRQRKERR